MNPVIKKIRDAAAGSIYQNKLYIVGGFVRDRIMGNPPSDDIDIVYAGNALELAEFLYAKGLSLHPPVTYPRFGTAMISIDGINIELVSARKESYSHNSRKPKVEPASLYDDIIRRDFTINTLVENIHTGEIQDLTAYAMDDIKNRLIRTPLDPDITFYDDPLRMLRAIRFSVKFNFTIEEHTYDAITANSNRLDIISRERIRDEFAKILLSDNASNGMRLLKGSGLLAQFAPELLDMVDVDQSGGYIWDVWEHTLHVLDSLPKNADLELRLASLCHYIAKPHTKTFDDKGNMRFHGHEVMGGQMTRKLLSKLRFHNACITRVSRLVEMHIRVGEYTSEWSDAAVRRLMHDSGEDMSDLIALAVADRLGAGPSASIAPLIELKQRTEDIISNQEVYKVESPLNGVEIMQLTGLSPGADIRHIKQFLVDKIIEGSLKCSDKIKAEEFVREWMENREPDRI